MEKFLRIGILFIGCLYFLIKIISYYTGSIVMPTILNDLLVIMILISVFLSAKIKK